MPPRTTRRRRGETLDERYFRVENMGHTTPCWVWFRAKNSAGYGSVWSPERKTRVSAHIAVYEEKVGPIPQGLWADHLCRHRACVNPAHIEFVTPSVNLRRGSAAKLQAHEYEEIVQEHENGVSIGELARRYGVCRTTITWHLGLATKRGRIAPRFQKENIHASA